MRKPRKNTTKVKDKKTIKKVTIFKTAIIIMVVAVVLVSVNNIFRLREENASLKQKNEDLISEKESLQEELKNVKDLEYIEEQARIQLRMIKPGEIIYILQDDKEKLDKEKDGKDKDE